MVRLEFSIRIVGMIVFGAVGWFLGDYLVEVSGTNAAFRYTLALTLAGAALGLLTAPWLILRPAFVIQRTIRQLPVRLLLLGGVGLGLGLLIALPLAIALSFLPDPVGGITPIVASAFLGALGTAVFTVRHEEIWNLIAGRIRGEVPAPEAEEEVVLLDTSVIIDGRIADISETGFVDRTMLIPRFILDEVQYIADSPDTLRRNRGRRGLDILNRLQKGRGAALRITDMDVEDMREVDGKLVALAKRLKATVITNDYNLNRVAELQGVQVLNINELANAVKAVFLPGEVIELQVIQEGKEPGQGVGYLDDGTMVVVENGRRHIGTTQSVLVTRVLQTVAGRMIFAQPQKEE
ncbi:MAG: PIN/TRAM domain-containing protein [Anaerolineae bacterium]